MSAGIYRKQFEALKEFADGLGISHTVTTASFNEKFCQLCKDIVDGLGETFVPKSGSFAERKGAYLWQVAKAVGGNPITAGHVQNNILQAAKAIYNTANDGNTPDTGASLAWRTYQYLKFAISDPAQDGLIQWLLKEPFDFDNNEAPDSTAFLNDVDLVESAAVEFNGIDQYGSASVQMLPSDGSAFQVEYKGWFNGSLVSSTLQSLISQYSGGQPDRLILWHVAGGEFRVFHGGSTYSVTTADLNYHEVVVDYSPSRNSGVGNDVRLIANIDGTIYPITNNIVTGYPTNTIIGSADGSQFFGDWKLAYLKVNTSIGGTYPISETSGLILYDISGNGNNITLNVGSGSETVMRSARQDKFHYNLESGCTLYEHATSPKLRVPYGIDGNPLTITPPSGYTKTADIPAGDYIGDIETKFKQQTGTASEVELLTRSIFSADGISFQNYTYDDMYAWINYDENVLFARDTISTGAEVINYQLVYEEAKQWTLGEYTRNNNYLQDEGAKLIPYETVEGIYYVDTDKLYLVEDA